MKRCRVGQLPFYDYVLVPKTRGQTAPSSYLFIVTEYWVEQLEHLTRTYSVKRNRGFPKGEAPAWAFASSSGNSEQIPATCLMASFHRELEKLSITAEPVWLEAFVDGAFCSVAIGHLVFVSNEERSW